MSARVKAFSSLLGGLSILLSPPLPSPNKCRPTIYRDESDLANAQCVDKRDASVAAARHSRLFLTAA